MIKLCKLIYYYVYVNLVVTSASHSPGPNSSLELIQMLVIHLCFAFEKLWHDQRMPPTVPEVSESIFTPEYIN